MDNKVRAEYVDLESLARDDDAYEVMLRAVVMGLVDINKCILENIIPIDDSLEAKEREWDARRANAEDFGDPEIIAQTKRLERLEREQMTEDE